VPDTERVRADLGSAIGVRPGAPQGPRHGGPRRAPRGSRPGPAERAVTFGGDRDLVGVVTTPAPAGEPRSPTAAIFLNPGLIHRVGAHRLNVRLARMLAGHGMSSLRFDLSGVGDSRPAPDARPLVQRWVAEIRSAMDFLQESEGAERFLVAGSCSGAIGAYLAGQGEARVTAVTLVNPPPPRVPARFWMRLAISQPNAWRRLLGGSWKRKPGQPSAARSVGGTAAGAQVPSDDETMEGISRLSRGGTEVLMVHSEWDPGNDYFHHILQPRFVAEAGSAGLEFRVIGGADHDFSLLACQEELLRVVEDWVVRRVRR